MGVPGFYRWLVQRYPLIRRRLNEVSRPRIDNLYIDFNCIVYDALRIISVGDDHEDLINEICRYVDLLVQLSQPQCLIYVAVDGPAPFAKCSQQRSRRFLGARDGRGGTFNYAQISVGTEFMEQLNIALRRFIKERSESDDTWRKPQVIYSSHRVPGEGEHKFFEYIRAYPSAQARTHAVYSPDADLIFLGLQTRQPYFYVIRQWDSWIGENERVGNGRLDKLKATDLDFEILHLPLVREYLKLDFANSDDIDRLIDDFTVMSYLLGNDFIPHFPDVILSGGDFEIVVQCYQEKILPGNLHLTENGAFNKPVLKLFLDSVVVALGAKPGAQQFRQDPRAARRYLLTKYPEEMKKDPDEFERQLSFSILDSFDWVLTYYTKHCCSWTWCFPYFYAPPLLTVAKYCMEHQADFTLDRPPLPFEQLMCILPPSCSCLVPEALSKLMFPPSDLAAYYPAQFTVDKNGRRTDREGVILIPLLPVRQVRKRVAALAHTFTDLESGRNKLEDALIFDNGHSMIFDLESHVPRSAAPLGVVSSFATSAIPFRVGRAQSVQIFRDASAWESLTLYIEPERYVVPPFRKEARARCLIGRVVLFDWPHFRPGVVSGVIDEDSAFPSRDKKSPAFLVSSAQRALRQTSAIELSSPPVIVAVRPIIFTNLACTRFAVSDEVVRVPYLLTAPIEKVPRAIRQFDSADDPPPDPGLVAVITTGPYRGRVGNIVGIMDNTAMVALRRSLAPDFGNILVRDRQQWISLSDACRRLQLSGDAAQLFFTSLPCRFKTKPEPTEADVACTAMSFGRVLDGCCRRRGKADIWLTNAFVHAARTYLEEPCTGALGQVLRTRRTGDHVRVKASVLFGETPRPGVIPELLTYVREQLPCSRYFLVSETLQGIAQETLDEMERRVLGLTGLQPRAENVAIPLDALIWEGRAKTAVRTRAEVGARVVVIAGIGAVPFGETGTVVAIDPVIGLYDVMLDRAATYGTTLRKRLQTKRGFVAKRDDLFFV
jgi:5'-3' exoribonuclease 1